MRRALLTIALAGLLAGCVRFKPEPLNPAANGTALESRNLADPQLRTFLETNLQRQLAPWPLKSWDFDALTMVAFFYNPSLDLARAQWQVALGGNKTAAARPNPTLSAVPGYDFSATSGMSPWIPSITFDVPIETAGKRGYRRSRARQLSEAARFNIVTSAWQVRATLRTNLLDFIAAAERERLLQNLNSLHTQILRSMEQRLEAGAVARSELVPARLARARLQLDLADARRQTADARVRLAESLGVSSRALDGIEFSYDLSRGGAATNVLSAELRGLALRSRADVLGALAEYAAAQSALQLEIAKQYPDLHLGPGYQYDQGDHKFTLSATLELPIFNQNQGPIAEAQAHRTEAAARFNALQSKIMADLDRAASSYQVTQENLSALEAFAATQRDQNEAISAQVKAGAADPLDLLNSQLELGLSELAQLDGRAKAQQALGALEDTLQLPLATMNPSVLEQSRSHATNEALR
jgi:cobalt-zinc-cadmium efflux system outer membrane protein